MLRPFVELLEIIRRMIEVPAPVETKPAHITLDRVDVFLFLLGGIGVIKAQVAAAPRVLRDAEVEANRLGVADVQVAVGLGRKARDDRLGPPRLEVGLDDVANEVAAWLALCRRLGVCDVLGIRRLVCRRLSAKSHPEPSGDCYPAQWGS